MIRKYIYAALAAAALGLGGYGLWQYTSGIEAKATAPVKDAIIDGQAQVLSAERKAREHTDAINTRTRSQESADAERLRRLAAAEQRLRKQALDSAALASATAEALRQHAADIERDFAECRREYVSLGDTAAAASRAAHALNDAWPDAAAWQARADAFNQLAKDITK